MPGRTFLYFAYGSNMSTSRLCAADRAPSARPVGTGYLAARRLTFDKAGRDGTGKCDAEATRLSEDRVYGVVFEIDERDRAALDSVEGLGDGYLCETVDVIMGERRRRAVTYVALRKNPGLLPRDWYKSMAVAGAREHGLPDEYVTQLESQEALDTRTGARRAKCRRRR